MALTKRHDPSFTKYLLSLDEEGDEGLSELEMTLEVV
jgi:hypothetical protein